VVKTVLALLHLWWYADRIRASPSDGRLLQLEPACLLRIRGEPAQVTGRHVRPVGTGVEVVYRCSAARGDFELVVSTGPGPSAVALRRGAHEYAISADEVEVFPAAQGQACSLPFSS
jgi:hypothetical protein